jgi:hypothetical protein
MGGFSFAVQMRMPALLVSHTALIFFDIGLQHICSRQGLAALVQGLALRMLSLTIAAGLDASRRFAFMREVHSKAMSAS